MLNKNYRVHPGSIMKSILMSIGETQAWLAKKLNMDKTVISKILNGKRSVSKNTALLFEKATGYPAERLLNAQVEYDLFYANNKISGEEESYEYKKDFTVFNNNSLLAV